MLKNLTLVSSFLVLSASASFGAGGPSSAGIGNPAAKYCVEVGGTTQTVHDDEGEFGLCNIGNATIAQWTLRRAAQGQTLLAVEAFLHHQDVSTGGGSPHVGLANPASVYCKKVGGSLRIVETDNGQIGICQFSDNSRIEEWTLFYGANNPGSEKLAELLQ